MNFRFALVLLALHAPAVQAEESVVPLEAPANQVSESIDTLPVKRFEITPQISVIQVSRLDLPNPGQIVNYSASIQGLPSFQVNFGRPVAYLGGFVFGVQASLGVGSRTSTYSVTPDAPNAPPLAKVPTLTDISLTWIPLVLSTKVSYRIPALPSIRPALAIGAGNLTVVQSSPNSSLNRTIGLPILVISPSLTFMDATTFHWLGGFTFGGTFLQGLGGGSRLSATSVDLSLNLLL